MGYFGIFAHPEPPQRVKTPQKKRTTRKMGSKERRGARDFAEEKGRKGKRTPEKRECRRGGN